jgi:transposase
LDESILVYRLHQTVVDSRFKFIKDPIFIGPLNIKRKDRLEALYYVALIALALYMILQVRVNRPLSNESEPVMLAGKNKKFRTNGQQGLGVVCSN